MNFARAIVPFVFWVGCAHGGRCPVVAAPPAVLVPPTSAAIAPGSSVDLDPTTTDPENYKVAFENDRVRVLRYHDSPGSKTSMHHHPDSMLYALSSFRRRLTFPDGTSKEVVLQAGAAMWIPAQSHAGENIGSTDCDVLLVEPKRSVVGSPTNSP